MATEIEEGQRLFGTINLSKIEKIGKELTEEGRRLAMTGQENPDKRETDRLDYKWLVAMFLVACGWVYQLGWNDSRIAFNLNRIDSIEKIVENHSGKGFHSEAQTRVRLLEQEAANRGRIQEQILEAIEDIRAQME